MVVLGLCVFVLVVWPGLVFSWVVGFFAYICSRDTLCHVILQLSFLFDLLVILRADTFLLIVSVPDTLSL